MRGHAAAADDNGDDDDDDDDDADCCYLQAVEAKRKSLSAMLCEKLQRVSEKRKHTKSKSAKSKSSKSFISKSQLHNDSRTTCLSSAATQSGLS